MLQVPVGAGSHGLQPSGSEYKLEAVLLGEDDIDALTATQGIKGLP